ncbi:MAG: helix-turn-helix domain-containing protein [Cetobacterium sp.]|uniref:helix-turn-helix domain-containing protein n=1 Tax=Cetobacterium sp. TaxID=2071632 RepID=UPI003F35A7A5
MLSKLKVLAEQVYENHNKVIEDRLNKEYDLEGITMYVHQDKARISISALNVDTQRQIDITAKKYSKLFNKYKEIANISYTNKELPKVVIDLVEQLQEAPDDETEVHYKLGYKYKEDGSIHYMEFERMQFVEQWLKQGQEREMIKVSLEEVEREKVQKLKSENISKDDMELLKYLKNKFGTDYINKTKRALEQLEEERRKRSLGGRKNKFNSEQIQEIRELRNDGATIKELSIKFECGVGTIHKLINENK